MFWQRFYKKKEKKKKLNPASDSFHLQEEKKIFFEN